ncbi:cyclodeaminase/cyclohydrolase family protein [Chlorobaculum sp. MV4-Y]|jgi:formiminotetrahydrofolate cyclodeaminase|uniref:cyclodeaminase/cyclohydrolase family protein n=1 Tax=Chlorobaculum sp. MV4-Y TaxID=2976335 RepID=UPI0021AEF057|nr:cyclodeaminase/cyclohydrolase family protein [Chlorobaculum sp. MV4-Y]UWX56961.1 cyclodeaminase/cyclohydrolase family protein [Chlorobaculum sp. MV4-Y]
MKSDGTLGWSAISTYLDSLASADPTPGGGAAAAVTAAQGVALLSMVCNLTIGKKKFADVADEVHSILEKCETARRQMLNLGDRDMEVFGTIMEVYKMPKSTPEEAEARRAAIQLALKASSEAPFELFKRCLAMLPLADRLEQIGNPSVLSDVIVGRYLLVAGLMSAMANVEVNLASIDDAEFCKAKREVMLPAIGNLGMSWRGLAGV